MNELQRRLANLERSVAGETTEITVYEEDTEGRRWPLERITITPGQPPRVEAFDAARGLDGAHALERRER